MANIKPLRSYSEHDVVNMYAFSGVISTTAGAKVSKGLCVAITGDGFTNTADEIEMIGSPGASYQGTVSQRYGVKAKVALCAKGVTPLGLLLNDVAEVDENGELLKFNPRKAAEMLCAISGQAVPVLTRGIVLYNGDLTAGALLANTVVYATGA